MASRTLGGENYAKVFQGEARRGEARRGEARRGEARQGKQAKVSYGNLS